MSGGSTGTDDVVRSEEWRTSCMCYALRNINSGSHRPIGGRPPCKREIRVQISVDPPHGPVVYRSGHLSLTQAKRVQLPPGSPFPALWRSSKRSGLISRPSKVQVLPAPPMASSSNGQDACPSNRERGFDSRRGYHCRSSSNGQSIRLRTGRLGDRTLRAAPTYRDRLTIGLLTLTQPIEV